jgi:hypothetical protein
MPTEKSGVGESASVQVTPATPAPSEPAALPEPAPTPKEETPAVTTTKPSILNRLTGGLLGSVFALVLVATVACSPNVAPSPSNAPGDAAGMSDSTDLQTGVPHLRVSDDSHAPPTWHAHLDVAKCLGEVAVCLPENAYETVSAEHNLLMTAGASQLWNGLSTAGLAVPWNTTNTQLVVGDASTAATAADTDMGAAVGTKINAADPSSCTNATPIVCAGTYSPAAVAGQVYVFSGFAGAGAAAINQTFEASAGSASSITLLNSAGTGAITVTGGLIKPINKYAQRANAAGSAVITTNSIVYVATFATTSANFQWLEWGVRTGAQITNMQAAPPANLLNHAIPGGGLGTKTSASSWTLTTTLSEN